jgi:hypothetical protein
MIFSIYANVAPPVSDFGFRGWVSFWTTPESGEDTILVKEQML